jgi:ubiquinone/menaquinone biosynthesis C-methylase UbiE
MWATDDPLWGVASWPGKEKSGVSPWTEEEFYELGESDWRDSLGQWQQYGIHTESCIEVGCGAGRMTRQLATSFDYVYAVDISEQMIRRAQMAVRGATNVQFSVIDGLILPQANCSVKAIFSTHVLQHLDNTSLGFCYFREFFRVLDEGGTIMIHLPLYQFPRETSSIATLMRWLYAVSRQLGNIRADIKRRLGVKTMRATAYPLTSLRLFLLNIGFKNVEFRIFPMRSNGELHPFVFATK